MWNFPISFYSGRKNEEKTDFYFRQLVIGELHIEFLFSPAGHWRIF